MWRGYVYRRKRAGRLKVVANATDLCPLTKYTILSRLHEDQCVITKTCPFMIVQEMPNSGCTLWPVHARKKSLTVYSPRPAFGGAADTLAVIESNMYDKWHSTWVESFQGRPWIAIFTFPSSASDRCTDRNIIGVPYGLDGNICQDKSMGDYFDYVD